MRINIKWTVAFLAAIALFITGFFFIRIIQDGYWLWGGPISYDKTGQVGDFIGGIIGTIFSAAGFWFLYLTLRLQRMSSELQAFELKFYELIRLHRENVSELKYTKYDNQKMVTSETRKVFRTIMEEFMECYQDVRRFVKMCPEMEILKDDYKKILETIRKENKCKADTLELALIDLSFTFFYYGLSAESETVLVHKFYNRYNKAFTHRVRIFLQLKPKKENETGFDEWIKFRKKTVKEMREILEEIFGKVEYRRTKDIITDDPLLKNVLADKYYGGHQHRFGHYLRHLFQTFKFLSQQSFLSEDNKYFYAKTLRAQLSTYEQLLIFFNSLSSLGMKWEYTPDRPLTSNFQDKDFKFITRYNLIKNLPGSQYYDFSYRKFYVDVRFEYVDDITYVNKTR